MGKLKFKYRPVAELVAYDKNPMIHPEPQIAELAKGISLYGFNQPIVVDASNTIIAGHGRLQAAMRLGLKEVPTVEVGELTPDQVRAYRIFDNKISKKSTFDMELLRLEVVDLGSSGFDLEMTGFNEMELDGIMNAELADILPDGQQVLVSSHTRTIEPKINPEITLPNGDKSPFTQMTFVLTEAQAQIVHEAVKKAREAEDFEETGNENSNGNALAAIAQWYLGEGEL